LQDKGKRKIAENLKAEKRSKMRVDPIMKQAYLLMEAKREQWIKNEK